jgi:uncharacterized protein YfaP (DUF2135 family)
MELTRLFCLLIITAVAGVYFTGSAQADQLQWQGPHNGWVYDGLTNQTDAARAAYPTPPIDRGRVRNRTMITGRLQSALPQPHSLAVNGNPLPLYTDAEGNFARPYALGPGSNSLSINNSAGQTLKRVQFYDSNNNKPRARIRLVLGWDDPQAEIDMHVITPDGQRAYYGDPILNEGGGLDPDGVDGPGPEIFSLAAPMRGRYLVYINYWGNLTNNGYNFTAGSNRNDIITTQITLVFNEGTVNEKRENFVVPLRSLGQLQLVKEFIY